MAKEMHAAQSAEASQVFCMVKTLPCKSMYLHLIKDYGIILKTISQNKLKISYKPVFQKQVNCVYLFLG